jgi:hypothetical protein
MTKEEWRKTWIDTLVENGVFLDTAEDAFNVCYENQDIDVSTDPERAASAFLPSATSKK